MTAARKILFSLLIAVILFAGAAAAAYTGLFDFIEARFYNPSITKSLRRETGRDAEVIQEWLYNLQDRFLSSLNEPAVRRSFLSGPDAADIFERERIYGLMLESIAGLQSIRFLDSSGARILFSTYPADIKSRKPLQAVYREYHSGPSDLPLDDILVPAQGNHRLLLAREQIIFSFPFYDYFGIYQGTALFTLSEMAVSGHLAGAGRLKTGEDISITAVPPGIVSGLPPFSQNEILAGISTVWNDGLFNFIPFVSGSGITLALVSAKTSQGIFYGRLVNGSVFEFSLPMKMILLASVFITVYLAVFFFFNIRPDPITVIQNRFNRLQISLIEQFYERKGDMDWRRWARELEQRREEIRGELKRGLQFGTGRYTEKDADTLIDKSWDELLALTGGRTGVFDEEKLRMALARVLKTEPLAPPHSGGNTGSAGNGTFIENTEELEELEAVEDDEYFSAAELNLRQNGGLLMAAERRQFRDRAKKNKKISNVRLAFGDDDIPYIVETSGIEIVDDENIDDAIRAMQDDDGAGIEKQDGPDIFENEGEKPAASPLSAREIADIASEIEFGPMPETDSPEEEAHRIAAAPLEVVSPFASMLSPLDISAPFSAGPEPDETGSAGREDAADRNGEKMPPGEKDNLASGMPVIYQPFQGPSGVEPELLQGVDDDPSQTPEAEPAADGVIVQQNGIHYINSNVLNQHNEEKLDSGFRELVESVVAKN
ncbi:MAG: hypothetical protein LBD48_00655 [Treponema sp.]|nr:hypothetical protein [Treponema sp.]